MPQTDDAPSCGPCPPPDWDEYMWTPSRLTSWLSEGSSPDADTAAAPDISPNPVRGPSQQEQVPQHLRSLLLLLLQATADSGAAQELIWTPARLAQWLAANSQGNANSQATPTCSTGAGSQQRPGTVPPGAGKACGLSSYLQHLPLVSRVAAIKGQKVPHQGGSSSSSSDVTGTAWVTRPAHSDAMQPSNSSERQASWAPCAAAVQQQPLAAGEVTSPLVQRRPQHQPPAAPEPRLSRQQLQQVAGQSRGSADCCGTGSQLPLLLHPQQALQQVAAGSQGVQPLRATERVCTRPARTAGLATAAAPAPPPNQLPRKGALPGDYPVVEDNPAWDPTALQEAAAAAARRLGLPVLRQGDAPAYAAHSNAALGGSRAGTSSRPSAPADAGAAQQCRPAGGPQLGVLMLVHEAGVAAPDVWQAWEGLQAGKVVVRVHLKAGVSLAGLQGQAWVSSRQLPSRVASQWGCISLTAALLTAAAELVQQHPQLQHLAVVSGQDVPLALLPADLRPGLSLFGRFQFGRAFDQAARAEAAHLLQQQQGMGRAEAAAWGQALCFHHTWLVLDRQLVLALINKQEQVLQVGAVLHERFMQSDVAVAADEFMLITAALRYGFAKAVVQKKLAAHMSSVRRQHSKQAPAAAAVAAAAAALHDEHQSDGSCCSSDDAAFQQRPAKQQRLGQKLTSSRGPDIGGPAAAVRGASSSQARSAGVSLVRARRGDSRSGPPPTPGFGLVGRRIEVWWQIDESYYAGTVTYFNPGIKRHTIRYDDGDVEIINLGKERWRLQDTQQHTAAPGAGSSAGAKQGAQGRGGPTRGSRGDGSGSQPSACALHEGTYGVLLDCCPTLALFHPTVTRHPQTWSSFSECLQVDVQSSRLGAIRLTLLEALGLGPANGALFFRKVAPLSRQGAAQLMACLQLLWRRKALPPTLEELVLVRQ